ncbi:MAG: flippase-like domain-containing protein [Chitinispirillales bacterium]|jgi:uncharacterized protein (TIRG00374 family)|nr:flippase-like domain-containing protein [Chitinispirillales bacterium]
MNAKKILSYAAKLTVTILVFWWIDISIGFSNITDTLKKANFLWFAAAIFVHVISIFIGAWQWGIILKNRGACLSRFEILKIYYTGMFFNNFILGTIAGDSFKIAILHKKNRAKPAFAATFLDRFAGFALLSVFAIVGSIIINAINFGSNKDLRITILLLIFFSFILAIIFILIFSKSAQNAFSKTLLKFPNTNVAERIKNIVSSVYIDRKNKLDAKMLPQIFSLSLLIQGLRISTHIFCAVAVGIFTFNTIHYYFVIIPITAILMMVPLPFGVIPTIAGAIFFAAGFSVGDATIMEFLASVAGIIGSLAGAVFLFIDRKAK